jgi:hypothetical protein
MIINKRFAILGVLILIILLFSGLPLFVEHILLGIIAVAIIFTSIEITRPIQKKGRRKKDEVRQTETFAESEVAVRKIAVKEESFTESTDNDNRNEGAI